MMQQRRSVLTILMAVFLACTQTRSEQLTAEAWQDIEQKKAVLVDVRTAEELRLGSIDAAQHVPHTDILAGSIPATWEKDTPLYLFCRSGRRAELARQALLEKHFTEVHVVGGYTDVKGFLQESHTAGQ